MAEPKKTELTNVQWAWEFLRRNQHYRFFYDRWKFACTGAVEITEKEREDIKANLDRLGAWRPRYEPWVRVGLQTGKRFIRRRTVKNEFFDGSYVEADIHFDPMDFMLERWIDPDTTPLPPDQNPFVAHAALRARVFRTSSDEFSAFRDLGLIDYFSENVPCEDEQRDSFRNLLDELGTKIQLDEHESPDSSQAQDEAPYFWINELYGWPRRPPAAMNLPPQDEEDALRQPFAQELEYLRWQLHRTVDAPRAEFHKILSGLGSDQYQSFDLTVNLQFDLMQPLREQIAAAKSLLEAHRDRIPTSVRNRLGSGFPEPTVVNVNDTYIELVRLLDAYDAVQGEEEHGRLAVAIRQVAGDKTLMSKESEYERLAKAFKRAEMLRTSGYKSLAFL